MDNCRLFYTLTNFKINFKWGCKKLLWIVRKSKLVRIIYKKTKNIYPILILIFIMGCVVDNNISKYSRHVGDSKFNAEIDTLEFKLCHNEKTVKQYFNFGNGLQYKGERISIRNKFNAEYKAVNVKQSGLIRIRFVVNCKGESGRFRLISSDLNYQEQTFDERITQQLLEITKSLDGWLIQTERNKAKDYYQYLIFKIIDGDLTEILP